jgi:hypothetical protein
MSFTVKYTAHPERKTAFTKEVEKDGCIHALIPKGSPWRNDIIERSNSTDNDECFHQIRFALSEDRRCQHCFCGIFADISVPIKASAIKLLFRHLKKIYPFHGSRMLT